MLSRFILSWIIPRAGFLLIRDDEIIISERRSGDVARRDREGKRPAGGAWERIVIDSTFDVTPVIDGGWEDQNCYV